MSVDMSLNSVIVREPGESDIPALAQLHFDAWNATYPNVKPPPARELRERQWREAFARKDGSWFCFVMEDPGQLIGFAKGKRYNHSDLPEFSGELNKIYLLRAYQRQGLGRQLVGQVARRFLNQGISSMVLFSEPDNPACRFYEALGGEKIFARNGEFHGTYGWRDLRILLPQKPPAAEEGGNRLQD